MRLSHTIGFSSGTVAPTQGTGLLSRIHPLIQMYRTQRAQSRRYRRDAAHLTRFTDRELWDLGLSRSDIPAIARGTYRRD